MPPKIKGYRLPEQIDDHPTRCIALIVPDDPQYLRDFWGHMFTLGQWFAWEHSTAANGDTRAKQAAEYWRTLLELAYQPYLAGLECDELPPDIVTNVWQDDENPCELWMTRNGEDSQFANLQLCPPLIRIGETGGIEVSTDGGVTWTPATSAPPQPRTPDDPDNRCLAAANAVNVIESFHYEIVRNYAPGIPLLALAMTAAAALLAVIGLWVAAIELVATMGTLLLYAAELTNEAFTTELKDELRCILFCRATDDAGTVTFNYGSVLSAVEENAGIGDFWNVIQIYLLWMNEDGLNRAGATTAVSEADCDCVECQTCFPVITFDDPSCYHILGTDEGAWALGTLDESFGNPAPSVKSGYGSSGGYSGFEAKINIPVANRVLTQVTFDWYWDFPGYDLTVIARSVVMYNASNAVIASFSTAAGASEGAWHTETLDYAGSEECTHIVIEVGVTGYPADQGTCWIDNVSMTEA